MLLILSINESKSTLFDVWTTSNTHLDKKFTPRQSIKLFFFEVYISYDIFFKFGYKFSLYILRTSSLISFFCGYLLKTLFNKLNLLLLKGIIYNNCSNGDSLYLEI